MGRAQIPVFLMPTRNHLGIIGPIPLEEFHPDNIQKKIDQNPIANCSESRNLGFLHEPARTKESSSRYGMGKGGNW